MQLSFKTSVEESSVGPGNTDAATQVQLVHDSLNNQDDSMEIEKRNEGGRTVRCVALTAKSILATVFDTASLH